MKLFTIGFTKKNAEQFFNHLQDAKVKKIIDTRLNNNSQLSGFAKKDDLPFFLREVSKIEYTHSLWLAPTSEILTEYKKTHDWETYERKFKDLLAEREIENTFTPLDLHENCLLCSEHEPYKCHRRIVAEYLKEKWHMDIEIIHLF